MTNLEKAEMCERLSFPPEDSRHIDVDMLLREYAAVLRFNPEVSAPTGQTCPRSSIEPNWVHTLAIVFSVIVTASFYFWALEVPAWISRTFGTW